MVTLVIKQKNGELYWKEQFQNKAQADKWLDEEKTRPYWKKSFEVEMIEEAPQVFTPDAAKEKEIKDVKKSLVKKLKDLGLVKAEIAMLIGDVDG
jgi:tRNA A37 threonylcarbamoyladenosine modification protein TsaB